MIESSALNYNLSRFQSYLFSVPALCSKPYSSVMMYSDFANWALNEDVRGHFYTLQSLGINKFFNPLFTPKKSSIYLNDMFRLVRQDWRSKSNRLAIDYFHGHPAHKPEFNVLHKALKSYKHQLKRVRVSTSQMKQLALEAEIPEDHIFQIPIGYESAWFYKRDPEVKNRLRTELKIPTNAMVIGSFQKDGTGWGEGLEPKLEKGPDILVQTLVAIHKKFPELWVLLTGPARGYVKAQLTKNNIPYKHLYLDDYKKIAPYYSVLDLYLITSRDEGGPRSLFESLASGVPVVTTCVGQAMDFIKSGSNGGMVDITATAAETANELYYWVDRIMSEKDLYSKIVTNGLSTVSACAYVNQIPLWKKFYDGFINASF